MEWYGCGLFECYFDRKLVVWVGIYSKEVKDFYVLYIVLGENGGCVDVCWVVFMSKMKGVGFFVISGEDSLLM